MVGDICVLSIFFNPFNSLNRTKNFYKFLKNISKSISLDDLYVLEISNDDQTQIRNCKNLKVKNDNIVWQKEAGINYLIKNLDLSKYSKIIVSDCDLIFKNKNWIKDTSNLLDKYHVCQPFKFIKYMNFNYAEIDSVVDGVVYGNLMKNKDAQYGNGGLVVGYNKEYICHMGELFDKAVVGGGDTFNILPFLFDCTLNLNIFDNLMQDLKAEYFDYLMKARNYVLDNKNKSPCFFADNVVRHLFHGSLKDRLYFDRYNLINKQKYYENFEKDENGLIKYRKESVLKDVIKNYFIGRKESFKDSDPIVWCNIKHEIEKIGEENKFMWLSEKNKILFQNISEIKLLFEKPEEINNPKIYFNDSVFDLIFDHHNKAELVLKTPKKIEIFSDYFIPKNVGRNPDTRRLSVMLKKIEIKTPDQEFFYEYPLENIL